MDKEFWRSFLGFLDDANDAEIQSRLVETRNFVQTARSPEVRSDARRMIALMEQELLARSQVQAARRS